MPPPQGQPRDIPPHPDPCDGQVLFAVGSGHTHVKTNEVCDGVLFVNPGSVSIPKDGTNSCMIYEDGVFMIKHLETAQTLLTWKAE